MSSYHAFFLYLMMLIIVFSNLGIHSGSGLGSTDNQSRAVNMTPKQAYYSSSRKLLVDDGVCTNRDIRISQSRESTSGIPQYTVQIVKTCASACAPSDIHLHCGRFEFKGIINPETFKRLSYDDCLVNGGKPLRTSESVRFTYSNSFMYELAFMSAKFCS